MDDLAAIDAVPQHQVERAAGESACRPSCAPKRWSSDLLTILPGFELLLEQPHRAEFGIAAEDLSARFPPRPSIDDELAVLRTA